MFGSFAFACHEEEKPLIQNRRYKHDVTVQKSLHRVAERQVEVLSLTLNECFKNYNNNIHASLFMFWLEVVSSEVNVSRGGMVAQFRKRTEFIIQ